MSEYLNVVREAIEALPVRLVLLVLIISMAVGFTRLTRLEAMDRFFVCRAMASDRGLSPAPCISHLPIATEDLHNYLPTRRVPAERGDAPTATVP